MVYSHSQLGNHDQKRIGTRLGEYRMDLYNTLLQTLPGIAVTYNVSCGNNTLRYSQYPDYLNCNIQIG